MTQTCEPSPGASSEPLSAWLQRLAGAGGDAPVTIGDESTGLTCHDFVALTYRFGRALARHGIDAGMRAVLVAAPTATSTAFRHAAALLGVETYCCVPSVGSDRVTDLVEAVDADVVAVHPEAADIADRAMSSASIRFVIGLGPVPGSDVDLIADCWDEPAEPIADRSTPTALELLAGAAGCRPLRSTMAERTSTTDT